jgi:hypothetical protein
MPVMRLPDAVAVGLLAASAAPGFGAWNSTP